MIKQHIDAKQTRLLIETTVRIAEQWRNVSVGCQGSQQPPCDRHVHYEGPRKETNAKITDQSTLKHAEYLKSCQRQPEEPVTSLTATLKLSYTKMYGLFRITRNIVFSSSTYSDCSGERQQRRAATKLSTHTDQRWWKVAV